MENLKNLKNLRFAKATEIDKSQWSTLEIRREDVNDVIPALGFFCLDYLHDFSLPRYKTKPGGGASEPILYDAPINRVEVPGRFNVQFSSADDLAELISTWHLLKNHYSHYQDIFKPGADSKWMLPILSYILDKIEGKGKSILPEWCFRILKMKQEEEK